MNIVYGAGAAGVIIQNYLLKIGENVDFFIDDNKLLVGTCLQGLEVHSFERVKSKLKKSDNIYCSFTTGIPAKTFDVLKDIGCNVFERDDIHEWENGFIQSKNFIEIDESYLIGRSALLDKNYQGFDKLQSKVVLVTGGAGSIGSEIVKSLLSLKVKKLIAVDIDESRLHELKESFNLDNLECLLCDISNQVEAESLFNRFSIDMIFHAAAYKHVPMTDLNPHKPLVNNILGSINILKNALNHEVDSLLLISTDKAVRPTNLMGASKRIIEKIYASYHGKKSTEIRIVRFGNVLKSRGSAIPKFINQALKGINITLTDSDMTRYFMTIEEAAYLSIKSAVLAETRFNTFVLNMGSPHRIIDIIERIKLFYELDHLPIDIVGIRPGEKLYEELHTDESTIDKTYSDIFRMYTPSYEGFDTHTMEKAFGENLYDLNVEEVKSLVIQTLDGEYRP